eukprot:Gb_17355 [translate_table: standard]
MTSSEANTFPDIWKWINGLPSPTQWKSEVMSVTLCGSPRVSLQFSAKRITDKEEQLLLFQLHADFQKISLYLWISQQCNPRHSNTMFGTLFVDFINRILQYGPEPAAEANTMEATTMDKLRDMLNCAFVCMCLCVCVSTANGFWKVRLYSPLLSMKDDRDHRDQLQCAKLPIKDDRLLFALRYQHLEAVIQLRYRMKRLNQDCIEVEVEIDNVRCDVFQLASSALMENRGIPEEKHFPSKIFVDIAPLSTGILSMSLSKSSDNPTHELKRERGVDMSVDMGVPKVQAKFKVTASEALAMRMKKWNMEQCGTGNVGTFQWILCDTTNGKEVAGSKPPKAWFKNILPKPFKRREVVFAGDKYSKSIIWRVRNEMEGKTLKWEVGGRIWVTFWPNKYKTSYSETRYVDFCLLLQALGTDIEEHLMRSMGLMTTNRLFDANFKQDTSNLGVWEKSIESPYMYSYSSTANGFWKVRLYSPLLSMKSADLHDNHHHRDHELQYAIPIKDDRLLFALRYQHLEAIIQFRYELKRFSHEWIEVEVQIDNVRCDIFQLASSGLMLKCGIPEEKHFPSKISVDITPPRTGILSMSLSKSSDNPAHELTSERTVEMGVEWPKAHADFKVAASEASAMSMKPWKMEQSGRGNVGTFEWILYDTTNGKEVAGSKPPKTAMYQHKAWFKDRYSNASKPFTRQGGVVFAGDKYSNSIIWRVRNDMEGKTLKWEVGGRIWVTYWPNKYKTSYSETRYVDFCEQVELLLLQQLIQ